MILRKPYAFLIKHFKLLHLIITIFMVYILIKTMNILSFLGEYITIGTGVIGQDVAAELFPTMLFAAPIIIIIFSLILLGVMFIKKKPYVMYIINGIIYIAIFVLFSLGNNIAIELSKKLVDIRTIKLVRDLITFSMFFQIYPLIKNFVRAVGFDIKQFDFGADLAQIEIEEKDNEEFEVELSLDTNKVKRLLNSKIRDFKYFYVEHKFLVSSIGGVVIVIFVGVTILGLFKYNNKTSLNQTFSMDGLKIKVLRSYSTNLNNKGNKIANLPENKTLIVVPISISNNNKTNKKLVTAKIELKVGSHIFRHVDTYRDAIIDLGNTYDGSEIGINKTINTALVFEIPTIYLNKKTHIKFITSLDDSGKNLIPTYADVKLNVINLDNILESIEITDEELDLKNSILGNTTIKINSSEISKRFRVDYNYCVTSKECIPSYEYVTAELNTNVDKSLLKLNGELVLDDNYKIDKLNYIYDLINYFGSIRYELDGTTKTITSGMSKVNPTMLKSNNTIYVSVPTEIEDSTSVDLIFKIRNKEYIYKVK